MSIKPPTIKWYEVRDSLHRLEALGAEYYIGNKKCRSGVLFKKIPPSNRDIHSARDNIERLVHTKWQRYSAIIGAN